MVTRSEFAQEVAARVIAQLEAGTAPWVRPWRPGELQLPRNGLTGRYYRGSNIVALITAGYTDPRFYTYRQAQEAGGQVRKGEKGTRLLLVKTHDETVLRDPDGKVVKDPDGQSAKIRKPRERVAIATFTVFNATQIEGVEPLPARVVTEEAVFATHERCEALLASSQARIRHQPGGGRAFYSPIPDEITLPAKDEFISASAYYATALHELGHWTGHPTRLDRDLAGGFGSESYAREELRAELASLMVGQTLQIGHDPGQHVAYIGSWVKALREDPSEILVAASAADKIHAYVTAYDQPQMVIDSEIKAVMQTLPSPGVHGPGFLPASSGRSQGGGVLGQHDERGRG